MSKQHKYGNMTKLTNQ